MTCNLLMQQPAEGTDDLADPVSLESGWHQGMNEAEEQLADAAEARLLSIIGQSKVVISTSATLEQAAMYDCPVQQCGFVLSVPVMVYSVLYSLSAEHASC